MAGRNVMSFLTFNRASLDASPFNWIQIKLLFRLKEYLCTLSVFF